MTSAAALLFVRKEARALSGAWLAGAAAIVVPSIVSQKLGLRPLVIPAYVMCMVALGALSVGHEYNGRTLSMLLTQPVARARLLLLKLAVLATMLLSLAAALAVMFLPDPHTRVSMIVVLPVLGGLTLAPWLTMATRSAMAGAVFTLAIPGTIFTANGLIHFLVLGRAPTAEFEASLMWYGGLALTAMGALMTWRRFMSLEAIDGRGPDVDVSRWLGRTAAAVDTAPVKRHAIWVLLKKELRVQQLALAVVGVYAASVLAARMAWPLPSDRIDDIITFLTFFYALLIVVLMGSLASAEERQLGTIEWQAILPFAAWKQWAVKAGVTIGLSLIVALVLPALLLSMSVRSHLRSPDILRWDLVVGVLTLSAFSLYVSSLCSNALRALMASIATGFAALLFLELVPERIGNAIVTNLMPLAGTLSLLLLWGALANHRSAEPGLPTFARWASRRTRS